MALPYLKQIQKTISVFENETIELQYGYCQNIGDNRGFTSGIAGWVTKWGDYLKVTVGYKPLAKFTSKIYFVLKLQGFQKAWVNASNDPIFRAMQDNVQYSQYFAPAISAGKTHGILTPVGHLVLCDTAIQHGMEDDSDESPGLITMLSHAKGASELDFLKSLLEIRRGVLLANGSVWAESIGRVNVLESLLSNYNLTVPYTINPFGTPFTIT